MSIVADRVLAHVIRELTSRGLWYCESYADWGDRDWNYVASGIDDIIEKDRK